MPVRHYSVAEHYFGGATAQVGIVLWGKMGKRRNWKRWTQPALVLAPGVRELLKDSEIAVRDVLDAP